MRLVGLGRRALGGLSDPEPVFPLAAPGLSHEFAALGPSAAMVGNFPALGATPTPPWVVINVPSHSHRAANLSLNTLRLVLG